MYTNSARAGKPGLPSLPWTQNAMLAGKMGKQGPRQRWPCIMKGAGLEGGRQVVDDIEPTAARPGSPEKQRVLHERAMRRQPLWHAADAAGDGLADACGWLARVLTGPRGCMVEAVGGAEVPLQGPRAWVPPAAQDGRRHSDEDNENDDGLTSSTRRPSGRYSAPDEASAHTAARK